MSAGNVRGVVTADTLSEWRKTVAHVSEQLAILTRVGMKVGDIDGLKKTINDLESEIFGAYVDQVKEDLGHDTERPAAE